MSNRSGTGKKRSRSESETPYTPDEGHENTRDERPRCASSSSNTLTDAIQTPGDFDPRQEQRKEETPGPGLQQQHEPSLAELSMQTDENKGIVVTGIRATGVALGLRRLPAGFYIVLHHSGLKWRTENKRSSVNHDTVEWNGQVPIPSDLSATVCIEVYASFECQPMLGAGEQLRKLTVTVGRLLDRSAKDVPFTFFPKDGDVASPCSSVVVSVKRRKSENSDSSQSRALSSHCPTPESQGELEDATNQGHNALSRYRKHGGKRDLEYSIAQFERALHICPLNHPCRAAAQSNLAMAKFVLCQIEDTDASLEVSLGLYRNALIARPIGHIDRPSTLIQLAVVHLARFFRRQRDEVEAARAEAWLHEAMQLTSVESHENRAAAFILQLNAGRRVGALHADDRSLALDLTSPFTDEDLWILSIRLLQRVERFGDLTALEQTITILKELVKSTSIWDARHLERLANLGVALLYRFHHLGVLGDLEDAISTLKGAVDLAPGVHPIKSHCLNNLGNSFNARFKRLGELSDLEDAISIHRAAVDLTSHSDPAKPCYLNNLGNCYFARFNRLGELIDLEHAISMVKVAVSLTPHGDSHKPHRLQNLGVFFKSRFQRLGELSDLEHAISRLREAVDLTPHGHPSRPSRLDSLGCSFRTRFERLGDLSDLEDAISRLSEAVDLTPHGRPDKPAHLTNFGISFTTRFEHLGELSDLENAISMFRDAVNFTPHGHPDRPTYLNNLANSSFTRFQRLGELQDLENAILTLREAVDLTPRGHPDKHARLSNLGSSFKARFKRLGELRDLEDAIFMLKDAIDLIPRGHPEMPGYLSNLGSSLSTRFERLGKLSDLESAVSICKDAVDFTPRGHSDMPVRLNNLGSSLSTRFERLGKLSDLESAVSICKDVVDFTPHGHPSMPARLNNLGSSLSTRFERLGKLSDLESAVSTFKDAVDFTPHGHPNMPAYLCNLAISLVTRFEHLGELADLEHAILMFNNAVELIPHGHPAKPTSLTSLGGSLLARFERLGELSDLEDTISRFRDAVDLTANDDPDKPGRLNNLGISCRARFEHLGELADLEDTISVLKETVNLIPHDHPHKPLCLNNLAISLKARFERFLDLTDLEDVISILRDAVSLIPHGHLARPTCLNNLGISFFTRFKCLGELSDLEGSISALSESIDLTPHGHPHLPAYFTNLGNSLFARFKRIGELSDLEDAISRHWDAVALTPRGHPDRGRIFSNLGNTFFARFERLRELSDLEHSISLYSYVASASTGSVKVRFLASQTWISFAQRTSHHSLLHAYSVAINLLPQLAWIGLSLTHRYDELKQGADVVRDAAAAALDAGLYETAVEWLEQGRSIVWGELFQLRSSYEELSSAHPDHAHRLRELSATLEHAAVARENSLSALSEQIQSTAHPAIKTLQQEADKHRMLAIERDKLLQEIRRLPGFEQFLLGKSFSQLRASTHPGPVVILNAAKSRCDALIVLVDVDHVIHAPLPNFTFERCTYLQKTLKGFLGHTREGKRETQDGVSWETFLSPLWKCVVRPVLDALAFSAPGDLSRIFWCPAGPFAFLPIHAAGFYDEEHSQLGYKVSDFVVSSYVPTLAILAPSSNLAAARSSDLRILIVRQPSSDGLPHLQGVHTEVKYIKEVIGDSPSARTTHLESTLGTVEEVLSLMKEAGWVHFACHGVQDGVDSGLCLAGGHRLRVRDIIGLARPDGGLAFLSACQTAKGDERLSDEAIHIAAGMLFAGYWGVIGTMWSISDRLAPDVARDVYEHLFRDGTRPDYKEAARALHEAIGRLRDSHASFDEWLPFIHIGL